MMEQERQPVSGWMQLTSDIGLRFFNIETGALASVYQHTSREHINLTFHNTLVVLHGLEAWAIKEELIRLVDDRERQIGKGFIL